MGNKCRALLSQRRVEGLKSATLPTHGAWVTKASDASVTGEMTRAYLWGVLDGCAAHFDVGQPVQVLQPRHLLLQGRKQSRRHHQPEATDQGHNDQGDLLLTAVKE